MDDLFGSNEQADPQSDFLARERAALGSDASSFAAPADSAQHDKDYEASAAAFPDLDGGDDDALSGFTSSAPAPAAAPTGQVGGQVSVTGDNEFAAFEQEYPEIDLPSDEPHQNGFDNTPSAPPSAGLSAPASFGQSASPSATPAPQQEGESEFIKSWREKQAEEIAAREEEYARKKEETIAKARNDIDNFYKEYNAKKEKAIAQNKEDEEKFKAALTDSLAKGTTWERICDLVELQDSRSKTTTKSKQDLTRFKELLLSLRREGETAPGAAGY
ncbi:clathrin light chain [Rhodotorula diobovata]|uniref:Clathrin light chain n=1 Tax=Rhodotorula diobovata TaxID=5288 RepID=A0A5C5G449_9BASI|nr:clathrin light chain [Rhodotorula diobovata]